VERVRDAAVGVVAVLGAQLPLAVLGGGAVEEAVAHSALVTVAPVRPAVAPELERPPAECAAARAPVSWPPPHWSSCRCSDARVSALEHGRERCVRQKNSARRAGGCSHDAARWPIERTAESVYRESEIHPTHT
jgi:hypothetical protein